MHFEVGFHRYALSVNLETEPTAAIIERLYTPARGAYDRFTSGGLPPANAFLQFAPKFAEMFSQQCVHFEARKAYGWRREGPLRRVHRTGKKGSRSRRNSSGLNE